jgi:HlyD family secretion protein
MTDVDRDPRSRIRRLNIIGLLVVFGLLGSIGAWAAVAELAGAVIAPGTIVVESNVKKVQHPTGGIVEEILVKEGDEVKEGDVLVRLDDTLTRATLGVVRSQLDELQARQARLLAERDDASAVVFPDELLARKEEKALGVAITGEAKLFESRRVARIGQRQQLTERVTQTREEIRGLEAQQQAKEKEIELIGKELIGVAELFDKKLVSITRYMQLQRDQARLEGERGQFIAEIARARGKISEVELQIIQLEKDFRTDVLKELRDTQGKIAELKERVTAAQDQLNRIAIRAPQSGIVNQLAIHTIGGVIANGETLMLIVPRSDKLIVEAKVAPSDVDQLSLGADTLVRIMAGNTRTMPEINGKLIYVSADLTREQAGQGIPPQSFYQVRVSLSDKEIARLHGLTLRPGMPAEAFIETYGRTPLQYLLKPLHEQISRTFRER